MGELSPESPGGFIPESVGGFAGILMLRDYHGGRVMSEPGYHPFIVWLGELLSIKTPELKSRRRSTLPSLTTWTEVARGGKDFEPNHPTTKLDEWLKDWREGTARKPVKPTDLYRGCVYAWQAFKAGKTLTSIKTDAKALWYPEPEALLAA